MEDETLTTAIAAGLDVPTSMTLADEDNGQQPAGCLCAVLLIVLLSVLLV